MNINKKIKLLEFKLIKILNGGLFGAYKSAFHGNGMEFAEHREYIFGDSLKYIDWKTSAKADKIYVKKYDEERDLNVLFLLDNSQSMQFGIQDKTKKELLEEIFYSLSFSAFQNNDNIGAIIFNENNYNYIEHKKSKFNIFRILENLENTEKYHYSIKDYSSMKDENYSKTEGILKEINKQNIKNNLIFILTDDTNIRDEKILKSVGNNNEIILINIFDHFENNLTSIKENISLNLNNNFLNINLGNSKKIEEYKKLRIKKINYLKLLLRKNKIGYINIDTTKNIYEELVGYFNKIIN